MSASRPGRAAALLLAALAGWGAARLPAAVAELGSLRLPATASALPPAAASPEVFPPAAAAPDASLSASASPAILAAPSPPPGWPLIIPYPVWLSPPPAPSIPNRTEALAALPQPQIQSDLQLHPLLQPPPGDRAEAPPLLAGSSPSAGEFADAAYARLRSGDRRAAAQLFAAAFAADPAMQDPRHASWLKDARALSRRWTAEGWILVRGAPLDPAAGIAAAPVLGGGQTGATLGFAPDPLARRPLSAIARFNAGTDATGQIDPRTGQAAFGVQWRPLPGVAVAAERLVATGDLARNEWLFRVSGGGQKRLSPLGLPVSVDGYGEASLLGNGDWLAGAQARALAGVFGRNGLSAAAGLGGWGSLQSVDGQMLSRLDVGPSASVRTGLGKLNLEASVDYRQRIAGQAEPGSGPVLTFSTAF